MNEAVAVDTTIVLHCVEFVHYSRWNDGQSSPGVVPGGCAPALIMNDHWAGGEIEDLLASDGTQLGPGLGSR